MKIGVTVGLGARAEATIDGLAERAKELERLGFAGMWMPNAFGMDAPMALALAGRGTTRIELGTAVVPTFPRHPVALAQQALTAQAALGGRFTLGIGLSHREMMDDQLGIPYEHPAHHMSQYLAVLAPLLRGERVDFEGDQYRVHAAVSVAGTNPVPLVIAALGPAMLRLAGRHSDGTITSWVGPRTIAAHIAPALAASAAEAGRPAPRIIVGLPIVLTNDAPAARERVASATEWYSSLPSYRAMLDREGVARPADIALIGNEIELERDLRALEEAGATDFVAQLFAAEPGAPARTLAFLASRL